MAEKQEKTSQSEKSSEVPKYPVAQIPKSGTKEVSFPACEVAGIQDRSPHEVQDSDNYPLKKHTSPEEATTPCLSKEMVSVGSSPSKNQKESCEEQQFFYEGTTGQPKDRVDLDGKAPSLNKTLPNGGMDDSQAHYINLKSERRAVGSVHQMDTPNVQKDSKCIQPSENSVEMSSERTKENEYEVEQHLPKNESSAAHDSLAGRYNQNGKDKSPKELRSSTDGEYGTGTNQKKTDYNVDIQHDTVRSEEDDEDIDQALLRRGSNQEASRKHAEKYVESTNQLHSTPSPISEVQDGAAGEKEIGSGKTESQKESEKCLGISQAVFQNWINHGPKPNASEEVSVTDASDSMAQLRANTSPPEVHRKSNAVSCKMRWLKSASSEPPDRGKKKPTTEAKSSSSAASTSEKNIFVASKTGAEVIKDNIQGRRQREEICDSQTVPTAFHCQVERNNEEAEEDKENSQTQPKIFRGLVPQTEGRINSEEEGEEDSLRSQTLAETVQDAVATDLLGGNYKETYNLASQYHCRSKYHDMKRNLDIKDNKFEKSSPWKSSGSHFIPNIPPQPPFAEMDNSFLPVEHSISDNNLTESDVLDQEEFQQELYGDTYRVSQPVEGVGSDLDADTQGESTRSEGGEMNLNLSLGTSSRVNKATRGKHGAKNVESTQSAPSPIYEVKYRTASRNRADGGIEVRKGKTKAQKDSENWMKLCQAKCQKFNEMSYKQRKDRERDYEPKVQVIVKNGAGQVMASVLCGQFQTYEELALQIGNKVFSENYVYPDFTLALYHENEIHLMGHDECIGYRADSIGGPLVLYVVPTMDIPEQWTWRLSCT